MTFYTTQKIILLLIYLVKASLCYTFQPPFTTGVFLWDLLETNLASLNVMAKNWEIYNITTEPVTRISSCVNYAYAFFGGIGIFPPVGTLERVYAQIPQHNIIYYNFELFAIGPWQSNHYISIQFGTSAPKVWYLSSVLSAYGTTNKCGGTNRLNYANYVVGRVFHTGDTLRITMQYDINKTSTPAIGFGLRDFTLSFRNSTASDVEEHYLAVGNQNIGGSTRCIYYQYWDTTTSTCKNCPTGCITCFGPFTSQCHRCAWGYSLVGTSCVPCPTNCGLCSGSNSGQCVTCYDGTTYLDWDKVCRASCTAPTIAQGSGDAKVCVSPCATNQYMIWNNTCVNSCTSPLFQSLQSGITFCNSPCNQAANEYYYWNGSCLTTCAGYYARNQEGYQFCDACQPGYFRYENGSCLPTCQSPFTQTTIGGSQFCNFPCNFAANEYLYWNNSCLPTCASYYSTTIGGYQFCNVCQPGYYRYENGSCLSSCKLPFTQFSSEGSLFCKFPCNYIANQYYYWNGSCQSTCTGYYPTTIGGYLYCYLCQPGYYRYENGSCLPTCQSPFTQDSLFCNFPCNYSANQYLYWNNSCLSTCTGFYPITIAGYQFCYPCQEGYFRYENGSCLPTCQLPFTQVTIGGSLFCNFPCNFATGEYYYWNDSCQSTCTGYYPTTIGGYLYCYLCQPGYYKYENESCLPTCQSPFTQTTVTGSLFCNFPCNYSANQHLYWNNSCLPTCTGYSTIVGGYQFCDVCQAGYFKYENGSCLPNCQLPFTQVMIGGSQFCNFPCNFATDEYLYWNSSCLSTCIGYYPTIVGGYKFCNLCQPGYYRYENGSCLPNCELPFSQIAIGENLFCNFTCNFQAGEYLYWNNSCLPTCTGYYPTTINGSQFCNPCQQGYFKYENGSCLPTCQLPFTQTTVRGAQFCNFPCSYAANEYFYWNYTCLPTCNNFFPAIIDGYRFCNPCQEGYFSYENESCLSTCQLPFTQATIGRTQFCNFPCNFSTNEYLYWNSSCLSACTGYYPTIVGGYHFCNVCQSGYYRYENGSCLQTCQLPFTQATIGGSLFCNFPCNFATGEYYYWNDSCQSTCTGYYPTTIGGYLYCYLCQPGYYKYENGSCLPTCQSPFTQTTVAGSLFCNFPCNYSTNQYLYWNNSCLPTCTGYSTIVGGYQFCDVCQAGYFRYENGSCLSTCSLPFAKMTAGRSQFCNFPCNFTANEYYNWDNSCSTNCTNFFEIAQGGYLFCDACQPNYFRYQNNSCLPTCEPKFSLVTIGRSKFCNFPCASNEFLNWDGSCIAKCIFPSFSLATPETNICSNPCTNDTDYFYEEESTCKPICDPPYQTALKFSVKICTRDFGLVDTTQTQNIAKVISITTSTAVLLGLVNSILGGNFELVMIIYMTKMLQYIKYLLINYPPKVQQMLDNLLSISGIFDFPPLPNDDVKGWFPEYPLPAKLGNGDFHSAFLANYFDVLFLMIVLVSLTGVVLILERHTSKNSYIAPLLHEPVVVLKWNFIFIAFCAHFGDVALYTCLQFLTFSNDFRTILSFSACLIVNSLGIFILFKIFHVIWTLKETLERNTQKTHASLLEDFEKKWKHYKVCFSEYKTERFTQQVYPCIYMIRMILFNIIIGALFRHPLFQALLLVSLSAFISTYIIWQKPMKKRMHLIQQFICELIILIFNSCVLCLAILDNTDSSSYHTREQIGDAIIYTNILMNCIFVIFESINAYLLIKKIINNLKKIKLSRKVAPINTAAKFNLEKSSQMQRSPIPIEQLPEPTSVQLEVNSNFETVRNTNENGDQSTKNLLENRGKSLFAVFGTSQYLSKVELQSEDSMRSILISSNQSKLFERRKRNLATVFLEDQQIRRRVPSISKMRQMVQSETIISQTD